MGSDYESHVATYIHRSLRRELKINATVLSTQKNRQPLIELLDRAEGQGNITPEDNDKLNDVDIVLTVDDSDEYILGEISITVQQDDVRRATEWAAILAKATGSRVTPVAIGAAEDPNMNRGEGTGAPDAATPTDLNNSGALQQTAQNPRRARRGFSLPPAPENTDRKYGDKTYSMWPGPRDS